MPQTIKKGQQYRHNQTGQIVIITNVTETDVFFFPVPADDSLLQFQDKGSFEQNRKLIDFTSYYKLL